MLSKNTLTTRARCRPTAILSLKQTFLTGKVYFRARALELPNSNPPHSRKKLLGRPGLSFFSSENCGTLWNSFLPQNFLHAILLRESSAAEAVDDYTEIVLARNWPRERVKWWITALSEGWHRMPMTDINRQGRIHKFEWRRLPLEAQLHVCLVSCLETIKYSVRAGNLPWKMGIGVGSRSQS